MPPRVGLLLAITFWGVSFVATKAAVAEVSPSTVVFLRAALGAAFLLSILALRREPLVPPRGHWLPLAVMGFFGVALHQALQAWALTLTTATNTGWLIGVTPLWAAILSAVTLRERLGGMKLLGLAIGFCGTMLVVTQGDLRAGALALPTTQGDLLVLASTVNWALYSLLGHGTIRALGPTRSTAAVMTTGAVLLLPLFGWQAGWRELGDVSSTTWAAIAFLGIACSGLGYLFWAAALERIEPTRVAVFLYLEPLVTLAAAVALLGETVHAATIAGGMLLLAGVAVVQRAPGRDGAG